MDNPDTPPLRWRRRRAILLRPMLIGSVLLHALLLVLLVLLPPEAPAPPPLPASSFEIVMDGGAKTPATPGEDKVAPAAKPGVDTPTQGSEPVPAPPEQPAPSPGPPAPAPAPAPAPVPSPPPAPAAPAPPPAPAPPAPAPPAPQPPAAAAPAPPPAPEALETLPQPSGPPEVNLPMPEMPPPVPVPEAPPPLPPPPAPVPRPRQLARPLIRPAPRSPSGFPAPQNWSLTGALVSPPAQQGASGHSLMAGPSLPTPTITGANLGRDWIAAYSAWVHEHLYYPEQAALNGEDGTTEVVVRIDRSGRVLSVELVGRSGSQWLDMSTTGMFRGARVPAFPPETKEDVATVDQTIHYILRRR